MDPVRYVSGLLLVGLLMAAAAWFLKRTRWAAFMQSGPIQLVNQVGVGPREKLVIVRYAGHEYLLGVTAQSITRLECTPINPVQSPVDKP